MTAWAIVAVPSRLDPVWGVSSEKVPHMTLLYFGEQNSPELATKIEQFLGHAVETGSIGTFGARVESRGTLGDDDADVLFFPKDWHSIQKVQAFRQDLLKNSDVFRAYNSTMQYPEWTPHLTLGYPDSPAKDPDGVYPPLTWVDFDRIEFWTGDYEGAGFQLQDGDLELMYSEDVENFLAHYGVKGMKWGVRRADKRDAKVEKHRQELKRVAANYKPKTGTKQQLEAERQKIQKRIDRMDMDRVMLSLGYGADRSRAAKRVNSQGKTSYQKLSAREKEAVDAATINKRFVKDAMRSLAIGTAATTVYTGGLVGVIGKAGLSPELTRQGQVAALGVIGGPMAKGLVSELRGIHTAYRFQSLSGRRGEIDRLLEDENYER